MRFFFLLIFTSFCPNFVAQIQFNEEAILLGCSNSSYGLGTLGGGISFFDFDKDGWDDLTVSSETGDPVRFYKNNTGVFSQIALVSFDPLFETKTVQWVDFDNDDDYDLFVTSYSDSNILYENVGNMTFDDITTSSGLILDDNSNFGSSWGDYDKDGLLDVFICSRSELEEETQNYLYHNNGDGTFTVVNDLVGIDNNHHLSFSSVFFDYNNDGWQDLYIANDKIDTQNLLYKNNGDGTFTEVGEETGTNISMDGMATTIGDYNDDGWLDIYVTNLIAGNVFLKNNGDGTFTDVASINGTLFESAAWGAVFIDAENDTDLDLYVSGELDGSTSFLPSAFYENNGSGIYSIPMSAGFENDTARSFSNAIGDINNDGYPDMTVLNYEPDDIFLWKNVSNQNNNWLKIKLEGVTSNRQGIGSWIEISLAGNKQYRYTLCGEGFLGQNSAYEFFGLGSASTIDYIKVTWLSGQVDIIENPTLNSHITIIEGGALNVNENKDIEVLVYPNPGKKFNIKMNNYKDIMTLTITDIFGKVLVKRTQDLNEFTINLSAYDSGVYFLNIFNQTQKITKKLIIN
ncbi:MAG: FG-GAP-like repeat-containing protein [Flavobacteriaceae bacterium]|nr:FG-GAP-like repeat-containing protein [Flavobacteriaceae bacterium]